MYTCQECGVSFYRKPSLIKPNIFCTRKCYGKYASRELSGASNRNWKGGVTPAYRLARTKISYTEWRSKVFERDTYTCQKCFKVGGRLNAHHLESFAENKKLREVLSNGVTLCEGCHKQLHREGSS